MNFQGKKINHSEELFKEIYGNDPKIIIKDNVIKITPYYWSFAFLINFIPFLSGIAILLLQNEWTVNLLSVFAVALSVYNLYNYLKFSNTIKIDLNIEYLKINPNFIIKYFIKETVVNFKNIQKIYLFNDNIWLGDRRYKILLTIENSKVKIKNLISTSDEDYANKTISELSKLL